jgi:hypothetical protein
MGMTTAARTGTRMTERCTGLGACQRPEAADRATAVQAWAQCSGRIPVGALAIPLAIRSSSLCRSGGD